MSFSHQTNTELLELKLETLELKNEEKKVEIPNIIDKTLLYPNGTFIPDEKRKFIEQLKTGHHKRNKNIPDDPTHRIDSDYSITVASNNIRYAHYNNRGMPVILGKGSSGKVRMAQIISDESKELIAVKILKPNNQLQERVFYEYAMAETTALRLLGRNKTGFLIRKRRKKPDLVKFQIDTNFAKGEELFKTISNNKLPYNAVDLLKIALNIVKAVQQFLRLRRLHRDIKEENFIIDLNTLEIILVDFSSSLPMDQDHQVVDSILVGTDYNLAPELKSKARESKKMTYSEVTEVYSTGKVLLSVLFGMIQCEAENSQVKTVLLKILQSNDSKMTCIERRTKENETAKHYDLEKTLYQFIDDKMLSPDPKCRPTLEDTIQTLEENLLLAEQAQSASFPQNAASKPTVKPFSFFQPQPLTLIDLLNQGIPIMDESKQNEDGSLKQFLIFENSQNYRDLIRLLENTELQPHVDFRIIGIENGIPTVEIMGRIKLNEAGVIVIEDAMPDANAHKTCIL